MKSLLFALILFVSVLFAQDSFNMKQVGEGMNNPLSYSESIGKKEEVSPVFLIFRIIGSLALLTGVIFGVVYVIKKSGVLQPVVPNPDSSLELLDDLATAPGNSIVLVRFEDKVLVIAQTGSSMQVIDTIDGDKASQLIAKNAGVKTVGTFKANLNKYVMNYQKGQNRG